MADKLFPVEGKRTNWLGLWYQPEFHYFSSAVINLADIRKFKGNVRLKVRKNQFYKNGINGRPNYVFSLVDAHSDNPADMTVEDLDELGEWEYWETSFANPVVWGYSCSECGYKTRNHECDEPPKYCPNCGKKMKER